MMKEFLIFECYYPYPCKGNYFFFYYQMHHICFFIILSQQDKLFKE